MQEISYKKFGIVGASNRFFISESKSEIYFLIDAADEYVITSCLNNELQFNARSKEIKYDQC